MRARSCPSCRERRLASVVCCRSACPLDARRRPLLVAGSADIVAPVRQFDQISAGIRDLADWRRSMGSLSGKSTFSIIRDKREQSFEMNLPAPSSRLDLGVEDWDEFGKNMDALNDELQRLGPELQRETQQAMMFRQDELDKMQRDVEKSMKHQSEEMEKSMKKLEPQLQKQGKEMQEQAEALRKEMEKMTPELLKQGMEIEKSVMPTQQDIEAMSRLAADQMKAVTPKIQQKMDEWRKKMEERERELQEQIRKQSDETGHPNHF